LSNVKRKRNKKENSVKFIVSNQVTKSNKEIRKSNPIPNQMQAYSAFTCLRVK